MVLWNDHRSSSSAIDEQTTENKNIVSSSRRRQPIQEDSNPRAGGKFLNSTIDEAKSPSIITSKNSNSIENRQQQTAEGGGGLQTTVIGDFETEMVFITDVLEPVFDTFHAIASEQGISFEVVVDDADDLPGVFVAPKSFQEATSNVLDNALKYVVLPKADSSIRCLLLASCG